MLFGITIWCFATSYAVALALEISRFFFRSGVRGAIMLAFGGMGLALHSVFLASRAVQATGSPLSSKEDFFLVAAWVLALTYLYLTAYHPKTAFGAFLLPLVLGLIGVGGAMSHSEPFAEEPASRVWGAIHGTSVLMAIVAVVIGFAAGLLYLRQAHRLKTRMPTAHGIRLPSLEWLQRTNSRAIVISMLMLGVGILSGSILNAIHRERQAGRVPWNDPFILGATALFGWLLLTTIVGRLYRPAREGHRVAYLTVVSFLFLVIALGFGLIVGSKHGVVRPPSESPAAVSVPTPGGSS
jgi:ABC-type uncharacterized transport system permease subunit